MNSIVKTGSFLAALAFLFLTGCSKETNPTPSDTVMGDPTRPGGPPIWASGDVYNNGLNGSGTDLYSEGDLPGRDPNSFMDGSNEEVVDVIYFGYDEFSIRPSERLKLEQVADVMRSNPAARLVAEGNTDWYGTTEYNLGLGDRRANAVKTYLVQLGISADRIDILSLGELEADQDMPKDSADVIDDRRVDLILLNG